MSRATSNAQRPLSIVIPSYNQGQFIERAIISVLEQKDPNLQLAIIDGGSKDDSIEVISKYERHLTYWCSEPDGGQSAAIVKGFQKIGGDLRGWLNSDDEYFPGAFRAVRRAFAARPSLGLVYGERVLINADSEVLGWSRFPPYDPAISGYTIASETAFWTEAAEQLSGPIDTTLRFAMDLDFFTRLFLASESTKLPKVLGRFRVHDESKSATIREVGREETIALWRRFFGDSETWDLPPKRLAVRHALLGLRHPRLIAASYLATRLRRSVRESLHAAS